MKEDGKSCTEITAYFHNKFNDQNLSKSTVATWYSPKTKMKLQKLVDSDTFNKSDTTINPKQRPRILIDVEIILDKVIRQCQAFVAPMTKFAGQHLQKGFIED